MSCLSCENYIPLDPPIQRTDSNGQTYEVCRDYAKLEQTT